MYRMQADEEEDLSKLIEDEEASSGVDKEEEEDEFDGVDYDEDEVEEKA